jgi:hypothetical protein
MRIQDDWKAAVLLALSAGLGSGCEPQADTAVEEGAAAMESPASNNQLHLHVRGDYEADLRFEGGDVSGSLSSAANGASSFSLSASTLGGQQEFFSLGSVGPIRLEAGADQSFVPERRGAQFSMAAGGAVHEANQGNARRYFAADAEGADIATRLVLDQIEQVPSPDPGMAWWRYAGHFSTTVAWVPDPPTKTCIAEAEQHPGRLPKYRAELCGARRMLISGDFVLVQEVPVTVR